MAAATENANERIAHRICPVCEATCGLEIRLDGDRVTAIRGHEADVFSAGFLCPKGVAVKDLHHDPDRLRTPLIKRHEANQQRRIQEGRESGELTRREARPA